MILTIQSGFYPKAILKGKCTKDIKEKNACIRKSVTAKNSKQLYIKRGWIIKHTKRCLTSFTDISRIKLAKIKKIDNKLLGNEWSLSNVT